MPSLAEFDKRLLPRLPLPLAQLYKQSAQAQNSFTRLQAAYFLWEAGLKLLGIAALTEYASRGLQSPAVPTALREFHKFGTGHWWGFLRAVLPELATHDDRFRAAHELILARPARGMPETARFFAELTDGPVPEDVKIGLLFDRLVTYRNGEIGHGAPGMGPNEDYEEIGKRLRATTTELFGRLDPLAGRQLLFVTNVYRNRRAEWQVDFRPLTGDDAQPTRTLPLPDTFSGDRLPTPEHLYLGPAETTTPADVEAWRSITPLAVFQADQVFLYNGRRGRDRIRYLCYTTGKTAEERYDEPARRGWPPFLTETVFGVRSDTGPEQEPESDVAPEKAAGDSSHGSSPGGQTGSGEPARRRKTNVPRWIGDCDIRSVIGQGATGIVYRAKQRSLEREVALKQLLLPERDYARFEREIRALARVDHPSVVKVHTSGEDRGLYYFTMDLVEGTDLSEVYRTLSDKPASDVSSADWRSAVAHACETARGGETWVDERPPAAARGASAEPAAEASEPAELRNADYVRHVAELVRQVAEGAHALHLQSIIHRDIKPGNIRVTPDGRRAVLVDLGLAKLADQTEGSLTRSRQIVGTLRYASPEQVLCDPNIDRGADVYSLGATLWELLTLRPMFDAGPNTREADLIGRIVRDRPQRPRAFNPHVPRDLEAIVLKCLEKNRADRYETAADLADDLSRWLRGEPVRAKLRSPVYMAGKFLQRNWLPATAAVAALYALLLTGGVLLIRAARDEAENKAKIARSESERAGRLAASLTAEQEEVKKKRDEAEAQRRKAEAATKKATQLAQASLVRDAFDYAEEGDPYAALAVLAGAAEQDSDDLTRVAEHRRRLVSGLAQLARLTRFWRAGTEVAEADLDAAGARLVTTHKDGSAKVWDIGSGKHLATLAAGQKIRTLRDPQRPGGWVTTAPDGWIATVHESGTIGLWRPPVDPTSRPLPVWTSDVTPGMAPGNLAESPLATPKPEWRPVARFSPDGRWFAAIALTGDLRVLALDGNGVQESRPPRQPNDSSQRSILDIAFSRDGSSIAIGCDDGQVWSWQLSALSPDRRMPAVGGPEEVKDAPETGKPIAPAAPTLSEPGADDPVAPAIEFGIGGPARYLEFDQLGRILCVSDTSTSYSFYGTGESQVTIWDPNAPAEPLARMTRDSYEQDDRFVSASVEADDAALLLLGTSQKGNVQAPNVAGSLDVHFPQHDPSLLPPEFSPDGRWAVFVHGTDVKLSPVLSGVPEYTIKHPGRVVACRLHADDPDTLTTVCEDGTVRVWLASDAAIRNTPPEDLWGGTGISLDDDGSTAVVQAGDGTLRFYDARTGARRFNAVANLPRPSELPYSTEPGYWVAPDAEAIVTREGNLVRPGGSPPDVRPLGLGRLARVVFSADGRRFVALADTSQPPEASAAPDSEGTQPLIQVFNTANGSALTEPFPAGTSPGPEGAVFLEGFGLPESAPAPPADIVLDPSGTRVLAIWGTGTRTWDLTDLGHPTTAEADEAISTARFTPDGELLLVHESGKVEVRPSATEAPAVTVDFGGDYYNWYQAAVAPGGQIIATANGDTVRVWARDGELLNVLKHPDFWSGESGSASVFDYSYYTAPSTAALRFSSDGRILAVLVGKDVHLWDARGGQRLAFPLRHHANVVDFRFTADPDEFVTLTASGSIRVWDLSAGQSDDDALRTLAVCQAGQRLSQHAAPAQVKAHYLLTRWAALDGRNIAVAGSGTARLLRALEDCESSANWPAVLKLADRVAAADPSSALVMRQAAARRQLGDYAGARREYQRAWMMGDAPTAHFSLADCFREEADRALDGFRTAASADLSPLDFSETSTYADAIARAEQLYDDCLKQADLFPAGDPDAARLRADVVRSLSTLARLCLRTNDTSASARAITSLRKVTDGPDGPSPSVLDVLRAEAAEWATLGQELAASGAGTGSTDTPYSDPLSSFAPPASFEVAEDPSAELAPAPAPWDDIGDSEDPAPAAPATSDETPSDASTSADASAFPRATLAFGRASEYRGIVLQNGAAARAAAAADLAADGTSLAASLDALTAHLLQYGPVAYPAPEQADGLPPMTPEQAPLAVAEALYDASLDSLVALPPADPATAHVRGGTAAAFSRLARTALEQAAPESLANADRLFGKARGIAEEHAGTTEILAALRPEADEWAAAAGRSADYSSNDSADDSTDDVPAADQPADASAQAEDAGAPADIVEGVGALGGWLFDGQTPPEDAPAAAETSTATREFEYALALNRLIWEQTRRAWEQSPETAAADRLADGQRLAGSINSLTVHRLKTALAGPPGGWDDQLNRVEQQYRDEFATAGPLPEDDPATAAIQSGFLAGYSTLSREALRAKADDASSHLVGLAIDAANAIPEDTDVSALRDEAAEWRTVGDDLGSVENDASAPARATTAYERAVTLRRLAFNRTRARQATDPSIDLLSDADSLLSDLNQLSNHLSNQDLDVEALDLDREGAELARSLYPADGTRAADRALQLLRLAYSAKEANALEEARDAGEEAAKVYDALFANPSLLKTITQTQYQGEAYYRGNAADNLYTLGGAYLGLGDVASASRVFDEAVRQREQIVRLSSSTPESISSLIDTLQNIGSRFAEQESTVREARAFFLRALEQQQQHLTASPEDAASEEEIAYSQEWLADLECRLGNVRAGLAYADASLQTRRRHSAQVADLPGDDEARIKALKSLGFALIWAGYAAMDAGRLDEAAAYAEELERLARTEEAEGRLDNWGTGGVNLATFYSNISHIYREIGDGRSARSSAARYVEIRKAIADLSGSDADRQALASAHLSAAQSALLLDLAAANRHYAEALAILDDLRSKPTRINLTDDTITCLDGLSLVQIDLGDFAAASTYTIRLKDEVAAAAEGREALAEDVDIRSQALALLPQATTDDAVLTAAPPKVASCLFRLRARAAARRGEYDLAAAETQRAATSSDPADPERRFDEATRYAELAGIVAGGRRPVVTSAGRPPVTTGYQANLSPVEAAARARFVALALDALEEAVRLGLEDRGRLFDDGPLDAVRGDERYLRLIESLPEATPERDEAVAASETRPALTTAPASPIE